MIILHKGCYCEKMLDFRTWDQRNFLLNKAFFFLFFEVFISSICDFFEEMVHAIIEKAGFCRIYQRRMKIWERISESGLENFQKLFLRNKLPGNFGKRWRKEEFGWLHWKFVWNFINFLENIIIKARIDHFGNEKSRKEEGKTSNLLTLNYFWFLKILSFFEEDWNMKFSFLQIFKGRAPWKLFAFHVCFSLFL